VSKKSSSSDFKLTGVAGLGESSARRDHRLRKRVTAEGVEVDAGAVVGEETPSDEPTGATLVGTDTVDVGVI
jgi:hypothetical protein